MKSKLEKALNILTILLSTFIGVCGACLIASSLNIYLNGGDTPYSPESVKKHILLCLPPLIITVLLAISVFVIREILGKKERDAYVRNPRMSLDLIYLKKSIHLTEEEKASINTGRKKAKIYNLSTLILGVVAFATTLICSYRASEYTVEDVNGSVINIVLLVFPLAIVFAGALYTLYLLKDGIYKTELGILNESLKNKGSGGLENSFKPCSDELINLGEKRERLIVTIARIVIPVASICFILLGILNGGGADVLGKAVRICTECIGLG